MTGVKNISAIELQSIVENSTPLIIDIRPESDYKFKHIPKSRNIPLSLLLRNPEQYLNKSQRYYIVCESGKKSMGLCYELSKKGYYVINVLGGADAYKGKFIN